jgi:integrase
MTPIHVSSSNAKKLPKVLFSNGLLTKYIDNVKSMSALTALQYRSDLHSFVKFVYNAYGCGVDSLIDELYKKGTLQKNTNFDPYDVLLRYTASLVGTVSAVTVKRRVLTARNFLEYCDIEISPKKFRLKMRLPKAVRKEKEPLSKEDIVTILNACSNLRLKTYIMLLAATGMRATEALSIRICDLDLKSNPSKLFIRGEYTKTISKYMTPPKGNQDLVFSMNASTKGYLYVSIHSLYVEFASAFGKMLEQLGRGQREESPGAQHRKVTLHSFRRWVKSTISDLGYYDYNEWFIGHSGSTYYRKSEKEESELFQKIEPDLTFLNVRQLTQQGADIQRKIDELEDLNQFLRQRDSMNADAITTLSDRLERVLQEVEVLKRENKRRPSTD